MYARNGNCGHPDAADTIDERMDILPPAGLVDITLQKDSAQHIDSMQRVKEQLRRLIIGGQTGMITVMEIREIYRPI